MPLLARLALVLLLAAPWTGCSMLQGITTPDNAVRTDQEGEPLTEIVEALGKAGFKQLAFPLSTNTVQRPILDANGVPLTDAAGNVLYETITKTEHGLPFVPSRTRVWASDKFVESNLELAVNHSPDGDSLQVAKKSTIDEDAYKTGANAQTRQLDAAWGGFNTAFATAANAFGAAFAARETTDQKKVDVDLAKKGLVPPGYAFDERMLPKEEEHHAEAPHVEQPAAPAEGAAPHAR